jgi:hypothetical protein
MAGTNDVVPELSLKRLALASLTGTAVWLSLQLAPQPHFTPRALTPGGEAPRVNTLAISETSSVALEELSTRDDRGP